MKRWIAMLLTMGLLGSLCACAPKESGPHTKTDDPAGNPPAGTGEPQPLNEVAYPAAVGFEDFEALRAIREQNAIDDAFLAAMDDFAWNSAVAVLATGRGNANYSPLSLYLALSLAATGAQGQTQQEMLSLLGVADGSKLAAQCAALYRLLYTDNEIGSLKIANSLWLDDEVQGAPVSFKRDFLEAATKDFFASVYRADFAAEATAQAMADWVTDNTNGKLTPAFPTDPSQVMSILNTVYFYDEWTDAFRENATKAGTFHAASGDVTVDFMNRTTLAGFIRGKNFTRAMLGLKNGGRMLFILPDAGVDVYDLLQNDDAVREAFQGGADDYGEVIWSVPKFGYGCKYDLADALQRLGMATAFDAEAADFSRVTDSRVWISKVRQETHIAIDEKGVEAAAFTEIGYAGAGMPQGRAEMILDRPFLYGIVAGNGTLLFMGVCADPSSVN